MIDTALAFLAEEANVFFQKRAGAATYKITAGGLANDNGTWAFTEGNIRMALVNVEEERVMRSQVPERIYVDGRHVTMQPDIKINLTVVFAARFNMYGDALHFLSQVITFFQSHPSFTPDEYPGMDPQIEKLTVEMLSLGPEQLNQMWAYIGTKYLPSVAYRVRMVRLQDTEPMGIGQPITNISAALHDK
jgi:hypothetical protein